MSTTSIIIATHERPHLLPRAIESARAAGTDVEVVVVDDASAAATQRICHNLKGITYVRLDRNQRVAGARNIGILNSTGEYLSFLDDDDTRLEGSIDLQVAALESTPEAGLIYGRALISGPRTGFGTDMEVEPPFREPEHFYPRHCPDGDIFWELLEQNFIPCGAAVFRRSCLLRVGFWINHHPGLRIGICGFV
jgi:glycosyltransferase involved in cell wall biosynthesis